jgi:predicted membrane-bound mannosyltransferase
MKNQKLIKILGILASISAIVWIIIFIFMVFGLFGYSLDLKRSTQPLALPIATFFCGVFAFVYYRQLGYKFPQPIAIAGAIASLGSIIAHFF